MMEICEMNCVLLSALCLFPMPGATPSDRADLSRAIDVLRKTTPDNQTGAREACKQLADAPVEQLPVLLAGMDGASAVARNWMRSSINQVLDNAKKETKPLPYADLEKFIEDRKHDPQARRFAYELVLEHDKTAAERFLPNMLDDPSPELRREAVARLLDQGDKIFESPKKKEAQPIFEKALASARDLSQVNKAARYLRDLGQKVDLPSHLGFVSDWKLIGPFPNPEDKGIDIAYPPEKKYEAGAVYDGVGGKTKFIPHISSSDQGIIDFDANLSKATDAVAYAFAEFTSDQDQEVDVRIGCYTAFKLWVNGSLALVRGDAFTGMSFDHYPVRVHLKKGTNTFLIKVSRAAPPPQVPNLWRFQLRVCDDNGVAILSKTRPPTPAPEKKS